MPGPIRDEWLPPIEKLDGWFEKMRKALKASNAPPFNSVTADFKNFVLRNSEICQQFNEMIDQVTDPTNSTKVCIRARMC